MSWPKGVPRSPETRAKMSEAVRGEKNPFYGHTLSPEARTQISEKLSGRTLTSAHRAKLSEARRGKIYSAETRAKMSEAATQRWANSIYRARQVESQKRSHPWGSVVGYATAHYRVKQLRGKPSYCAWCLTTEPSTRYEWAYLYEGEFSLNSEDYERLCKSCHNTFDNIVENLHD